MEGLTEALLFRNVVKEQLPKERLDRTQTESQFLALYQQLYHSDVG